MRCGRKRRSQLIATPTSNPAPKRYLALDLSLNRPGAASLLVTDKTVEIEWARHLVVDAKRAHQCRLHEIREWLRALAAIAPVESPYAKEDAPPSAVTGAILNRVHGVAQEALAPLDFVDIPQGTVKAIVVGRGGEDVTKGDVEAAVRAHLALPASFTFTADDEADAVAVGLAYLTIIDALPQTAQFDTLRARLAWWMTKKPDGKALDAKTKRKREKLVADVRKKANPTVKKRKGANVA